MKFSKLLFTERITSDPSEIDERIKRPLSGWEFAGLALTLIFPVMVMLISPVELGGQQAYDFQHYLNSARGDFSFYYYAHWLLPLWQFLGVMPLWLSYLLWTSISVLSIFFASRMFGARPSLLLFSYQTLIVLYLGQFTGILIGGLSLLWWGLTHKRWYVAGIGLLLAASKYHTGLIPSLVFILCLDINWRDRFKTILIPAAVGVASLFVYPLWPLTVLETFHLNPPNAWGSVSLWQWIGPAALLAWIPPLMLKLSWRERMVALLAAAPLGIPYYQQADLLILMTLPIGWLPVLGNLGFLKALIGHLADNILVVIPAVVYLSVLIPAMPTAFRPTPAMSNEP